MATVLVVDDDPISRDFLRTLLGYRGHQAYEAADGDTALMLAGRRLPDAVAVGSAGAVHVTVATPSGVSATSSSDLYTSNAASGPALSSLGTSSGTTDGRSWRAAA